MKKPAIGWLYYYFPETRPLLKSFRSSGFRFPVREVSFSSGSAGIAGFQKSKPSFPKAHIAPKRALSLVSHSPIELTNSSEKWDVQA